MATDMLGYAEIPEGARGFCKNTFSFTGQTSAGGIDKVDFDLALEGHYSGDFDLHADPGVFSWSPCDGSTAILNMNTQCAISPTTQDALIAVRLSLTPGGGAGKVLTVGTGRSRLWEAYGSVPPCVEALRCLSLITSLDSRRKQETCCVCTFVFNWDREIEKRGLQLHVPITKHFASMEKHGTNVTASGIEFTVYVSIMRYMFLSARSTNGKHNVGLYFMLLCYHGELRPAVQDAVELNLSDVIRPCKELRADLMSLCLWTYMRRALDNLRSI